MAHAPPMRNHGVLNCSDVFSAEILAQQEAQADSLAAEVLMSLGCSDSGGNGSDDSQAAVSSPPAPPQLQARPQREQRPQPEEARPASAAPSTPPVEHKLIITPAWQVCFFPLLQGQSDRAHSCQVSASTVFMPGKLALGCHTAVFTCQEFRVKTPFRHLAASAPASARAAAWCSGTSSSSGRSRGSQLSAAAAIWSQVPTPRLQVSSWAPPTQCITTGWPDRFTAPAPPAACAATSAYRLPQPLPKFMPPPQLLQTPLFL